MKEVAKQMKHNIFEVLSLENVTIDSDGFAKLLEALRVRSFALLSLLCVF